MGKVKWNYETCKKEALKYEYKSDFKKTGRAYVVARKNKWLDDWFSKEIKCKWTYKKCEEESKKYDSYSKFNNSNYVVYNKCLKKGWIKNFTWLHDDRGLYDEVTKMYVVYKYEWEDTGCIYIGLTKNLKERDKSHKIIKYKKGKEYKSAVYKYCEKTGLDAPTPIILERNLNSIEAREREDYWVKYYNSKGFILLNTAKTGAKSGSVGGPIKKWHYKLCYDEAKKYSSRTEFEKSAFGAYRAARKNGWLNEFEWLKPKIHPNGYWTRERCYEEAKKYEFWGDFERKSHSAQSSAKNNNWLKDYTWLKYKRKKQ